MFVGGIVNTFGGIFHEKGVTGCGWRIFAGIVQMIAGGFVLAHPLLISLVAPSAMTWILGVGAVSHKRVYAYVQGRRHWSGPAGHCICRSGRSQYGYSTHSQWCDFGHDCRIRQCW